MKFVNKVKEESLDIVLEQNMTGLAERIIKGDYVLLLQGNDGLYVLIDHTIPADPHIKKEDYIELGALLYNGVKDTYGDYVQ